MNLNPKQILASTKSLIAFLVIYLGSVALLFVAVGYTYFNYEKERLVNGIKDSLHYKAQSLISQLEYYHEHPENGEFVIETDSFDIAFFDIDGEQIASTFSDPVNLSLHFEQTDQTLALIEPLPLYYLGVKYVVVRKQIPQEMLEATLQRIFVVAGTALLFMLIVGYLLSKLMLKPLKDSLSLLNRFIRDTTHEMNTPVSTILMSYEHMDKSGLEPKQLRALNRMEISAKTLSNLYNDLTFVAFNEYLKFDDEPIEMTKLVEERIGYFTSLMQLKSITLQYYGVKKSLLTIDRKKITRVIDNLISNAIKYSRQGGMIEITLSEDSLSVKDHGIGIPKDKQKEIFKRFVRVDNVNGGFGIGLDIVTQVCKEYGIRLELTSEENQGSEFKLIWQK